MGNEGAYDTIAEIAGNQEAYNSCDLKELSLEQAIRLMQLHKMHKAQKEMVSMSQDLKDRHRKVHELHKLLQLIQKNTIQEDGPDRGKLKLTHPNLKNPHVELAADLSRALKGQTKQVLAKDGSKQLRIDLTDDANQSIRDLLVKAKVNGLEVELKDVYEGEEVQKLQDAIKAMTGIQSDDAWNKVKDILELRIRLQQAKEVYGIEFKWPADEYPREDREALTTAIDTTCKDLNLQNDMQMHDINRAYQERLEILQMARSIIKTLHDDKIHKSRSSGSR